ncbi:hypothetical protein MA16_Dca005991 [Dendrobium catenatum]|uniref:Uncharacterized protein n=1 Tax=Dendrobium catenatum TaxID=906689 RepID=A0A2I0WJW2_9ASPA|nr:hypothetical protein MA16_Dca005991 [Dendrobium catenatum]
MYKSPSSATKKGLNLPFMVAEAAFGHRKLDSDLHREQEMNFGLLRFSSAPTTLFGEDFQLARPSSPEMESLFARFLAQNQREEIRSKSSVVEQRDGFSSMSSHMLFHSQQSMANK